MAKRIYFGISNKARKTKKVYIGIGGKARKVRKGYIGIGGKAHQFYSSEPDPQPPTLISPLTVPRSFPAVSSDYYPERALIAGGCETKSSAIDKYDASLTHSLITGNSNAGANYIAGAIRALDDDKQSSDGCVFAGGLLSSRLKESFSVNRLGTVAKGELDTNRSSLTGVRFNRGYCIFAGGYRGTSTGVAKDSFYLSNNLTFTSVGTLGKSIGVWGSAACIIGYGAHPVSLIFGSGGVIPFSDTELVNNDSNDYSNGCAASLNNQWAFAMKHDRRIVRYTAEITAVQLSITPVPHIWASMASIEDLVVVFGGGNTTTHVYTIDKDSTVQIMDETTAGRIRAAGVGVGSNLIFAGGNKTSPSEPLDSVYVIRT